MSKNRITVKQLEEVLLNNFAFSKQSLTDNYGYLRSLTLESEEAKDLLRSIARNSPRKFEGDDGKFAATYGGFVAGLIAGLLLAQERNSIQNSKGASN
jgi:hypothetical protein